MKSTKTFALGLSIILMMTAGAPFAFAQADQVRWDIINIAFGIPPALLYFTYDTLHLSAGQKPCGFRTASGGRPLGRESVN